MKFIKYLLVASSLSMALFACGGGDDISQYKRADTEVYEKYWGSWNGLVHGSMTGLIYIWISTYDGDSVTGSISKKGGEFSGNSTISDFKGEINADNVIRFSAAGYDFEGDFIDEDKIIGSYKKSGQWELEIAGTWFAEKKGS